MDEKHPDALLTNQDKAMKIATQIVFPKSNHRFCLWHTLRKIPKKLRQVIKENENFMRIFNKCVYNSWTEEDFEIRWLDIIEKFEFVNNE